MRCSSWALRAGERVLLALADSIEFVATWYAVQKIGAVTAEVYTFLQPKDYAYYLDYTAAVVVVVDRVTLDRVRRPGRERHPPDPVGGGCATRRIQHHEVSFSSLVSANPPTSMPCPPVLTTSRSGSSPPGAPASQKRACTRRGARSSALRRTRRACSASVPTTSSPGAEALLRLRP